MELTSDTPESTGDSAAQAQIDRLQSEIAQLQAQIAARDNLLAVAAHELRNPMHTILLLVRAALLIAQRENPAALTPKLERIRHVVDTYMKRATLLLDSARMEARGWVTDRTEFDLAEVVTEICASYEPEAQYAGSQLAISLSRPLRGCWDRLAVEQMVANLVSNAIKYGAGRPVAIHAGEQDGVAMLRVLDHGIGIAESDQQRIFERFQQALGSARRRSGFGIGLWLVNSLVQAHGGSITVQSRLHEGSTFTILLPGLADPQAPATNPQSEHLRPAIP